MAASVVRAVVLSAASVRAQLEDRESLFFCSAWSICFWVEVELLCPRAARATT